MLPRYWLRAFALAWVIGPRQRFSPGYSTTNLPQKGELSQENRGFRG
jgi:hypothetical protein